MKNLKIKKRDFAFFLLGILKVFIIEVILDWEGNKKAFLESFNSVVR